MTEDSLRFLVGHGSGRQPAMACCLPAKVVPELRGLLFGELGKRLDFALKKPRRLVVALISVDAELAQGFCQNWLP